MKGLGYAILAVAALVSLVFVNALKPNSLAATAFLAVWLVLPYAVFALGLRLFANQRTSAIAYVLVIAIVTLGGLLFLTYIVFLRPDPQGGIAVVFTPIYQALAIGILVPTCRWLIGKASA